MKLANRWYSRERERERESSNLIKEEIKLLEEIASVLVEEKNNKKENNSKDINNKRIDYFIAIK